MEKAKDFSRKTVWPGSTQLAWLYRKGLVWTDVLWLWASCVPGCFLGALALKVVPIQWLQIGISLMIACFVVLQLIKKNATFRIKDSAASLLVTGLASGFANSSVSVGGVPIGIFLLFNNTLILVCCISCVCRFDSW